MPDADVVLYPQAFSPTAEQRLFATLYQATPWEQHVLNLFGRSVNAPRLSAWYGDSGACYRYSGVRLEALPWTPALLEIKLIVEGLAGCSFNSVLLNLYRDGADSVGWHADAEPELGRDPTIASVSLGSARLFRLQHKKRRLRVALQLQPGSVLVMRGVTQHHWRHSLPKTCHHVGARVNLTFRRVRRGDELLAAPTRTRR
jgi:alkylated DNA repair dioxygenase AlkB